jgi:predicted kinase
MNNNKPTLYLIRGLPGSGKSTFAKQLFDAKIVADVFEADQWFENNNSGQFDSTKLHQAHKACQQWAKMLIESGESVAVSNTSTTEKEVQVYQAIAVNAGANFVSLIVENRNDTKNIHNVPPEHIEKMRNRFTTKL